MKRSDVFEVREPPPHGWTRLKARLGEKAAARWPWVLAVSVAAAALLVVLLASPRPTGIDPSLARLASARLHGEPRGGEPVMLIGDRRGAILRVATKDPQVVMYRVAMISPDDAPPTE